MSSKENGDEKTREMTGKTTGRMPTATTIRLLSTRKSCTGSRPVEVYISRPRHDYGEELETIDRCRGVYLWGNRCLRVDLTCTSNIS